MTKIIIILSALAFLAACTATITPEEIIFDEPTDEPYVITIPPHDDHIITLEVDPYQGSVQGLSRINITNRSDSPMAAVILRTHFTDLAVDYISVNNEVVDYQREGERLILPTEIAPGETVHVRVQYRYETDQLWFGAFLPVIYNQGFLETANYQVSITAPVGYTIVGTGHKAEELGYLEDSLTTHFTAHMVRDFAFGVLPDHYRYKSVETASGIEIKLYYSDQVLFTENDPYTVLATATAIVKHFENRVGVYPFGQITIIEVDMGQSYQAFPQVIFLESRYMRRSNLESLVSAIGQQWFGQVVGIAGDTTLCHSLIYFLQAGLTYDTSELFALHMAELYDFVFVRNHFSQANMARIPLYQDVLMLYRLEARMGEEMFWAFINQYYQKYSFQTVMACENFINMAIEVYGEGLGEFFEAYR